MNGLVSTGAPELRVRRLRPAAKVPRRATDVASGFDLVACLDGADWVDLGQDPVLVPTGLALEFPFGLDVSIRPRSGLSLRGVAVTLGTIDADYRGEILVGMYTFGSRTGYRVNDGDRIAQLVVCQLATPAVVEVTELSTSVRDTGGHGSTGLR